MNNTINKILTLAIVASMGFSSCKKQKDDLDLGGTKGGEKHTTAPHLRKITVKNVQLKKEVKGFVNADCECQTRNLESGDKKDGEKTRKIGIKKTRRDWEKGQESGIRKTRKTGTKKTRKTGTRRTRKTGIKKTRRTGTRRTRKMG